MKKFAYPFGKSSSARRLIRLLCVRADDQRNQMHPALGMATQEVRKMEDNIILLLNQVFLQILKFTNKFQLKAYATAMLLSHWPCETGFQLKDWSRIERFGPKFVHKILMHFSMY